MANNSNRTAPNRGKRQPQMRMARQPETFHAGNPKDAPPASRKKSAKKG